MVRAKKIKKQPITSQQTKIKQTNVNAYSFICLEPTNWVENGKWNVVFGGYGTCGS